MSFYQLEIYTYVHRLFFHTSDQHEKSPDSCGVAEFFLTPIKFAVNPYVVGSSPTARAKLDTPRNLIWFRGVLLCKNNDLFDLEKSSSFYFFKKTFFANNSYRFLRFLGFFTSSNCLVWVGFIMLFLYLFLYFLQTFHHVIPVILHHDIDSKHFPILIYFWFPDC